MNCEEVNARLDLLMDGQLTDDQMAEIEAHGQNCPACADAIRQTLQLKALLQQLEPEVDVPLKAQAKWRGAVREEARRKRAKRLYRWIGSAAAAVVVLVGVGLALNQKTASPKGAELAKVDLQRAVVAEEAAVESAEEDVAYEAQTFTMEAPVQALGSKAMDAGEPAEVNAVIETDGAAESEAFEEIEEAAEADMCAAVALNPSGELTLHVKDVDAACRQVSDLAQEYEGEAQVQRLEAGGADVYVTLDAANAADFLNAVSRMRADGEAPALPELAGEGSIQLLLTLVSE